MIEVVAVVFMLVAVALLFVAMRVKEDWDN